MRRLTVSASTLLLLVAAGCGNADSTAGGECRQNADCPSGRVCSSGTCLDPAWSIGPDAGEDPEPDAPPPDPPPVDPPTLQTPPKVELSGTVGSFSRRTISLRNTGDSPLEITGVEILRGGEFRVSLRPEQNRPPEPPDSQVAVAPPVELAGGASRSVDVWYRADDGGADRATLAIESTASNAPHRIALLGDADGPCFRVRPSGKTDLGTIPRGESTSTSVQLHNCTNARDFKVEEIRLTAESSPLFDVSGVPPLPVDLPAGGLHSVDVGFVGKSDPGTYSAELLVETDVPGRGAIRIPLSGTIEEGPTCPKAVARVKTRRGNPTDHLVDEPLQTVELLASQSSAPDGRIAKYRWTVVSRPPNSTARLTPDHRDASPKLFLDVVGTWTIRLAVWDETGRPSCKSAEVTIDAVPENDIYVQLTWDTPADKDETDGQGADLDLHYLNAQNATKWNAAPWDIFWHNKTADWGQPNVARDNPSLDIDDTDGVGPEAITHDNPASGGRFKIGVYYNDDHGFGQSKATVRVYSNGTILNRYSTSDLRHTFDFWHVADIAWPSKNLYRRDRDHRGFPTP